MAAPDRPTQTGITEGVRVIFARSEELARIRGDAQVELAHLWQAVSEDWAGLACQTLRNLDIDIAAFAQDAVNDLPAALGIDSGAVAAVTWAPDVERARILAFEVAAELHRYVGSESLLLGLLRASKDMLPRDRTGNPLTPECAHAEILRLLSGPLSV